MATPAHLPPGKAASCWFPLRSSAPASALAFGKHSRVPIGPEVASSPSIKKGRRRPHSQRPPFASLNCLRERFCSTILGVMDYSRVRLAATEPVLLGYH